MDVQEELNRVLRWIAALLILLLQWLYPRVLWSHVLSRMFYDYLTLLHDLTYWVYTLFISLLYCMLWDFGLSVQMHGKPFPVWGSYNTSPERLWICVNISKKPLQVAGTTLRPLFLLHEPVWETGHDIKLFSQDRTYVVGRTLLV